ncbi:DUF5337 family protein [Pseudoroseicyclus tamaricis]|uniref:DUF5337 domain-containing protein n=1 Tax=Pseudoroseicyclus tamaricis TaxID=2705421 RepID=A0A6B2JSE8_9RHOB|nr:DUF5337 family protein [Pseudoroseicyclus tamaricis]NDV01477.1 DUF5337 domain-containing protein [Pseudoroseicyclus tamaricis]
MDDCRPPRARAGRAAALVMAGTGLYWIAVTYLGAQAGWPTRIRALLDLFALAGFGLGLWMTWRAYRLGRDE